MGRWTDERCTTWWGDRQCLDERDHIDNDGGGHHVFDLTDLGFTKPVLVNADQRGLRDKEDAA